MGDDDHAVGPLVTVDYVRAKAKRFGLAVETKSKDLSSMVDEDAPDPIGQEHHAEVFDPLNPDRRWVGNSDRSEDEAAVKACGRYLDSR